ncbi:DUF6714 family protein [Acidovorax sp. Leaf78]|uniref:DUF6714 family protein n=1 Tax=Acidovorax sp. Leaf78 TaxID=1736237 RepID=UPI000B169508|nr:DUF6714 family protein [Acidovorax sp. Leaf78]
MQLLDIIDHAFKKVDFPPKEDLIDCALPDQDYGFQVAEDLENWRTRTPDEDFLREMHQELRKLSAVTTRWIIPHYLRYALTEQAKYSRMETSFFVLSLVARSEEEIEQVAKRLSSMNTEQVRCLKKVLEYLRADTDWAEYMGEYIEAALATLRSLRI